jgi:ABC-type multidrug transport system fused ATPase/permease subunit
VAFIFQKWSVISPPDTVGRTGSGKVYLSCLPSASLMLTASKQSSLMLSLLRCIFTEGDVYYDGISTASLNLEALRTNVTVIPQVVGSTIAK